MFCFLVTPVPQHLASLLTCCQSPHLSTCSLLNCPVSFTGTRPHHSHFLWAIPRAPWWHDFLSASQFHASCLRHVCFSFTHSRRSHQIFPHHQRHCFIVDSPVTLSADPPACFLSACLSVCQFTSQSICLCSSLLANTTWTLFSSFNHKKK